MTRLSRRQRQVLDFLRSSIERSGIVPSVREVASALGLRSAATAQQHIDGLIRKGYLRRLPDRMRALEILHPHFAVAGTAVVRLPVLGRVTAGRGAVADDAVEEFLPVPRHLGWQEGCFILRVRGDSMIGAGIFDGDMVIVRRQDSVPAGRVVVALIGEEATVKRLHLEDGTPVLVAENPAYPPIREEFSILGQVVGLIRRYDGFRHRGPVS
ncbi:MAG: transcriptional repressor LexA [Armatimonadota bacterium]|nr:transcriptional repressor LexA [Armatimonadota bacterium]MDR5696624.1 transcriptional repressor LexA [Armatimonadota bacterium]